MDKTIGITILLSVILYIYSIINDEKYKKIFHYFKLSLLYFIDISKFTLYIVSLKVTINFDLYKQNVHFISIMKLKV